jgi:DNA invertase Pin-like site-specific DNA recombinase
MSGTNGNGKISLDGPGGSYLRVSGDRQETERQLASRAAFEKRHGVRIADHHHYEDDMPRDLSARRPDFQRMLRAAQAGALRWIFVDHIDRFGFADEWELVELIQTLRKAGCKLYDSGDDEWTARGLMSFFKAGLAGHSSHDEQVKKSLRCLGGMVAKARAGEWQGGPPRLGFDVACFDRATGAEVWRVVWEGRDRVGTVKRKGKMRPVYHIRRLKVYPDGRQERLDGNVVFRTNKDTQVMRIVPTRDEARRAAAQGVFTRYAAEAVSFFDLAKWLNDLGIRNSFGQKFQSNDIRKMLADEAYLGYPTFRKRRNGRFHRYDADGGIVEIEPELRGKDTESDPADVIRSAARLFEPLVDRPTWDAVQRKLQGRTRKDRGGHVPKNPALYLAGLVRCAGCGEPMVARADRTEYYCATWDRHRTRGTLAESPCLRNGVRQAVLEEHVNRYLRDAGKKLDALTARSPIPPSTSYIASAVVDLTDGGVRRAPMGGGALTGKLEGDLHSTHDAYLDNYLRMLDYIRDNDAEGWAAMWEGLGDAHEPAVERAVEAYRRCFDPDGLKADIAALEAEHTALMRQWADLPTPRAKEKAKAELAALEARIEALEKQQQDIGAIVAAQWQQVLDLSRAIKEAHEAMECEGGAHALRQRAEALRGLLVEIRCEFVVTGKRSSGPGQAGSKLAAVGFLPVAGDAKRLAANGGERDYGKP